MQGKTVKSSELSTIRMVETNEEKYPIVIENDHVKEWVGIGWIPIRLATDEDRREYPTVVD